MSAFHQRRKPKLYQLPYADEITAGVFSSKLQDGSNMAGELRTALELIMEGYQHAKRCRVCAGTCLPMRSVWKVR